MNHKKPTETQKRRLGLTLMYSGVTFLFLVNLIFHSFLAYSFLLKKIRIVSTTLLLLVLYLTMLNLHFLLLCL